MYQYLQFRQIVRFWEFEQGHVFVLVRGFILWSEHWNEFGKRWKVETGVLPPTPASRIDGLEVLEQKSLGQGQPAF